MIEFIKSLLRRISGGGSFKGSAQYWEKRYQKGGNSGSGSYGKMAEFKARFLNRLVADERLQSVIEFGCGDGNQLLLAAYPSYIGVDVSPTAVTKCRERFQSDATKKFLHLSDYREERADLSMSLDVIYHLVEDAVYEKYMRTLFAASNKLVVIYSCDAPEDSAVTSAHVRPRRFSAWITQNLPGWKLKAHVPNELPFQGDSDTGSWSDFYVYERVDKR
jgi:cyclopropane fatty-acyl-phospholipid synthase-like methyltransferase